MGQYRIQRLGRLPAYPDARDYSPNIIEFMNKTGQNVVAKLQAFEANVTAQHSNRSLITRIEDQGNWGACVGFGCNYAMEMIMRVVAKRSLRFSARYTYRMGRFLAGLYGDSGLWVKNGLSSLVRYGLVDESRYPYDTSSNIDEKVDPDLHGLADDLRGAKYFRLDYPNVSKSEMLQRINKYIQQRFPVVMGFYCFDTLFDRTVDETGSVPYPAESESTIGGHCVCLVGYDDSRKIQNPLDGNITTGAWQFVNSWSQMWGDGGFGYLPYDYLLKPNSIGVLADEFYTITKAAWIDHFSLE